MATAVQERSDRNETSSPSRNRRLSRNSDTECYSPTTLLRRRTSEAKRKRKSIQKANGNPLNFSSDTGFASEDTLETGSYANGTESSRRRWMKLSISDMRRLDSPMGFYLSTNPLLDRFRRLVRSLILWIRLYHYHSSQVQQILLFFSNVDLGLFEKRESSDDLMFSPAAFKANKQAKISKNSIQILRKDPKQRTENDLRPIMAGLRSYEAIGDFPKDIIERIARKAWFQEFEPASVIVREGDLPLYYYFILSGTVLVSVIDRVKMIAKTVCTLSRGDAFGELAIAEKARRKSTVIATEKTGLLILEDTDYVDIFMNGGVRFLDDPFLKTLTCFEKFPIQCLKQKPKQVLFSYFKAGTILVEDSKMSSWIFIVKSGSCRVMMPVKRLDLVEKEKLDADRQQASKEAAEKETELSPRNVPLTEHETVVRRSYRSYMKKLAAVNPIMLSSQAIRVNISLSEEDPNSILSDIGREDTNLGLQSRVPSLPDIKAPRAKRERTHNLKKEVERKISSQPTKKRSINLSFWSDKETVQGRRTIATDLNREYYYKRQKEWLLEVEGEKEEKQLITIQILTRGMTFGFIDKYFEHQPSLKLISDGCECFIIKKDLYFENADEELLRAVGFTLRPFPRESDVIGRKIEQIEWQKHRKGIMDQTLQSLNVEKVNIHDSKQYWPAYQKLPPIH